MRLAFVIKAKNAFASKIYRALAPAHRTHSMKSLFAFWVAKQP